MARIGAESEHKTARISSVHYELSAGYHMRYTDQIFCFVCDMYVNNENLFNAKNS